MRVRGEALASNDAPAVDYGKKKKKKKKAVLQDV